MATWAIIDTSNTVTGLASTVDDSAPLPVVKDYSYVRAEPPVGRDWQYDEHASEFLSPPDASGNRTRVKALSGKF